MTIIMEISEVYLMGTIGKKRLDLSGVLHVSFPYEVKYYLNICWCVSNFPTKTTYKRSKVINGLILACLFHNKLFAKSCQILLIKHGTFLLHFLRDSSVEYQAVFSSPSWLKVRKSSVKTADFHNYPSNLLMNTN